VLTLSPRGEGQGEGDVILLWNDSS
jgi:hypothetical protein